jgi:hypothetical protein
MRRWQPNDDYKDRPLVAKKPIVVPAGLCDAGVKLYLAKEREKKAGINYHADLWRDHILFCMTCWEATHE